jgi:hypothetical protein
MMRRLIGLLLAVSVAGFAHAAQPAPTPPTSDLSLTIYNSNLALVQDHRVVDLPAGRSKLELKDVSAAIRPETATLTGGGVTVLEQNFDFDLLTPQKMMQKAVGRQIQIVRINPGNGQETRETATVLSANGGVVLQIGDRIEVLRDDGVPTRVIFDKVPETLRAQPTLSVMVTTDHAGPRAIDLSYLTTGLGWKADYVALFDEAKGQLDVQGWITLTNTSGSEFDDAKTLLVAGDVAIDGDTPQPWIDRNRFRPGAVVQPGAEASDTPSVGDFHLYPLPDRTTVADRQTKQVGFITAQAVRARKLYQYKALGFQSLDQPQHVDAVINFDNTAAAGLGHPLPAGTVRLYQRDASGQAQFIGESAIDHTPQGSDLSLKTGQAFDVTVQPTVVASHISSDFLTTLSNSASMSYAIHNAKASPVVVEVRQGGFWLNGRVVKESQKGRKIDAYSRAWDVDVPAHGVATLTFTVQSGL